MLLQFLDTLRAIKEEPRIYTCAKIKLFAKLHYRGTVCVLAPIIFIWLLTPFPPQPYQWTGYCIAIMAAYWVSECIPLALTSFFPIIIFPFAGVSSTGEVCRSYFNDTVLMFLGSLILAYSIEQCGLHKRLAYIAIRSFGYSHVNLLLAMCVVTTFVSMWITNTAAATMMVPIIFAVLKVFEDQKLLKIYDTNSDGEKVASDITTCYFCVATYSATIGGIGTLVGTATNLVFKGLLSSTYPKAPELLSFLKFSAFGIPLMIILDIFMMLYMLILYVGCCRPRSATAKKTKVSPEGMKAAQKAVNENYAKLGRLTCWEGMVILLFGGAMLLFFFRSPQTFKGWGDLISDYFELNDTKFVRDSALAALVVFLMFLLPSNISICKNFTAKFHEDFPKRVRSVLDWNCLTAALPYSFVFLLGGGFALSDAAKKTGLNEKIGESLQSLKSLPNIWILLFVIIFVVLITNLGSNVAVCNVVTPICMTLAKEIGRNPLWYALASGLSSSFCFMLPVGTPGNLVVQSAAKIPTIKMVKAGLGPTFTTILFTWLLLYFYAPVIWSDLATLPEWTS
ncbi:protein I'm not dead yet-like [Bicyclus anynana]|uniref:Protein I'm not dead yet-like n=1 Tax=Bicyclus anynana TaxID=110368 RepID=A0ABM3LMV4_BICAN|nr:protein I'm not dead yet-like [Bicyclus anynana]